MLTLKFEIEKKKNAVFTVYKFIYNTGLVLTSDDKRYQEPPKQQFQDRFHLLKLKVQL